MKTYRVKQQRKCEVIYEVDVEVTASTEEEARVKASYIEPKFPKHISMENGTLHILDIDHHPYDLCVEVEEEVPCYVREWLDDYFHQYGLRG